MHSVKKHWDQKNPAPTRKKTSTVLCCDEAKRSTKLMSFFYSNFCKPPKLKPALKNVSVSQHQPVKFKKHLNTLRHIVGLLGVLCRAGIWTRPFWVPSNSVDSVILQWGRFWVFSLHRSVSLMSHLLFLPFVSCAGLRNWYWWYFREEGLKEKAPVQDL